MTHCLALGKVAACHWLFSWCWVPYCYRLSKKCFPQNGVSIPRLHCVMKVKRHSDAVVNDDQHGLNDAHEDKPWTLREVITKLTEMAQTWEKLLYCSGGKLSKCSYYIFWKWIHCIPQMSSMGDIQSTATISLASGNRPNSVPITQQDTSEGTKTLGMWMAPSSSELTQIEVLFTKAHKLASLIASSNLTCLEAHMAYHMFWIPSVTYSFQTTTMLARQLAFIQSKPTQNFLQKMGLNRNFP